MKTLPRTHPNTSGASTARAIELLPVEDFTRTPATSRARVLPAGDKVAFLGDRHGRTLLHILDLKTDKTWSIDPGETEQLNNARKEVSGFSWVGDDRLFVSTSVWDLI